MKTKRYVKIALLLVTATAIASCRTPPAAPPPAADVPLTEIRDRFWLLSEVRGEDGALAVNRQLLAQHGIATIFTLRLDSNDGTVGGTASLNAYWGPFSLSGDRSLSFGAIQTSLLESRDVAQIDEETFLALLAGVTRWSDMGRNMVLHTTDAAGPVTMIFTPPGG